jgi:sulfite exporter TauE/SafE
MNTAVATTVEPRARRSLRGLVRRRHKAHGVSFPELVWLHHLRQQELKEGEHEPYSGPAEDRYRRFVQRFEDEHGRIVDAYWCTNEASAVALTVKRRPLILPDVVRLHWATDWATKEQPKLMTLLYRCESIAVRVHEVLRDTSQRLAMQSIFTVISFLLGFGETDRARNDRAVGEIERTTGQELKLIESYYRRAAVRSGQIVYVGGMLLGMLPLGLLIVLALVLKLADSHNSAVRIGILCFAAGGVGALMSVMSRMNSGRVRVDWEFGKDTLRTLGALRPFVGGVFGLMTFFALKSGVVALDIANNARSTYFYVLFAFAAGFSERLAQDMLLGSTVEAVGRGRRPHRTEAQPDEDTLGAVPPAEA